MTHESRPVEIMLSQVPELAEAYFTVLAQAGLDTACIFGGAVRDSDYSHRHSTSIPVTDYDTRIWVPQDKFWDTIDEFCARIEKIPGAKIHKLHWWASNKPRYEVELFGGKMDVSFRGVPPEMLRDPNRFTKIAVDRAMRSDVGISAVALTSDLHCWARPEYEQDINNKTITVFPSDHEDRSQAYAKRLIHEKFKDHTIVHVGINDLGNSNTNLVTPRPKGVGPHI